MIEEWLKEKGEKEVVGSNDNSNKTNKRTCADIKKIDSYIL